MFVLRQSVFTCEFPDGYQFGGGAGEFEQFERYQVVVENDVGPAYKPIAF